MTPAYLAFTKQLKADGWNDLGRNCWARQLELSGRLVDAANSTIVARWVDSDTGRGGYQRMLEEANQLALACRAALDKMPAPARPAPQSQLFGSEE